MVRHLLRCLGAAVFSAIALAGAVVLILCMLLMRKTSDEDHA